MDQVALREPKETAEAFESRVGTNGPPRLETISGRYALGALLGKGGMADVRRERARQVWIAVYDRLGTLTGVEPQYVSLIRNVVAFGLGTCEAWTGMPSAIEWAERLGDDPFHRVSALQLKRTVRIQLGDWEGAERFRKEAEVLAFRLGRDRCSRTSCTSRSTPSRSLAT